jgi:hypothetical protein
MEVVSPPTREGGRGGAGPKPNIVHIVVKGGEGVEQYTQHSTAARITVNIVSRTNGLNDTTLLG